MDSLFDFPAHNSEEWWRVTLSSIGDAVIVTDVKGKIAFMNSVAQSLTGWGSEDAKQRPLEEVFPIINERSRTILESPVSRVLQTGAMVELANHTVLLTKNGVEIPVDDSAAPIRDERGNVLGVVLVFRDISERKRAEAVQFQLKAIIESADDAIIGKTLEGIITSWNPGAERMFGYTEQEAIGQSIYVLIPPDRYKEEEQILSRLRQGERIDHYETVRVRKDGQPLDISLSISPIMDEAGRVISASKIARDITDQKRAEAAQAYLAAIIESSDDAIIGKNLQSIITSWNKGAERIFGYTEQETIGQCYRSLENA